MQAEGLVETLGTQPGQIGAGQLQPHVDGQHAGQGQQRDRSDHIAGGDALVVDSGQKAVPAWRIFPGALQQVAARFAPGHLDGFRTSHRKVAR